MSIETPLSGTERTRLRRLPERRAPDRLRRDFGLAKHGRGNVTDATFLMEARQPARRPRRDRAHREVNTVPQAIDESRLINRIGLRLMPLLGLLYLVAYIDRSNISFAKLQMLGSLGLSEVAYGLGASLFFIGYLIFEVPSNVLLHKYGAPKWMARIMLTWGIVTILLAFTRNATMFYVLRFLLGASEAGLYPGVIYYLTLWFPQRHRVRMLGYFTVGSSLGNMVGAPICGWLLDKGGLFGLQGWQLVFIITGIPSVLLTFVVLFLLPASPREAKFLSDHERNWLARTLEAESAQARKSAKASACARS